MATHKPLNEAMSPRMARTVWYRGSRVLQGSRKVEPRAELSHQKNFGTKNRLAINSRGEYSVMRRNLFHNHGLSSRARLVKLVDAGDSKSFALKF